MWSCECVSVRSSSNIQYLQGSEVTETRKRNKSQTSIHHVHLWESLIVGSWQNKDFSKDNQWVFYISFGYCLLCRNTQLLKGNTDETNIKNEEIAALILLLRLSVLNHQSLIWTTHKDGIISKRTETQKGHTRKVKRSFEYLGSAVRKHVQKQTDKSKFSHQVTGPVNC